MRPIAFTRVPARKVQYLRHVFAWRFACGDINDATAIAGYLIGDGRSIVSIDSRLEKEKMEFKAPAAQPPDISIAVLVNSGTASEAGALMTMRGLRPSKM